jgi:hypothetical protein
MLRRVWDRHRYMQDEPAYREFLEEISGSSDIWKVPQCEIAQWWERRQSARLTIDGKHTARVTVDIPDAVVEIDGEELRVPPFELDGLSAPYRLPTYSADLRTPFLSEVLGHLGYGHVGPNNGNDDESTLDSSRLSAVLQTLKATAREHHRYEPEDLAVLTKLMADAHDRCHLPQLRIWSLPHSGGIPWRVSVSTRYDVDKAIVNLPAIRELEAQHGLRSTVYLRPFGMFYGQPEIEACTRALLDGVEYALHGEFVSTAESRFGNELKAAIGEKQSLSRMCGTQVHGVCMHGGELRTNTSSRTRDAIEDAGFLYETMYRNLYFLPLHLPTEHGVRKTISIGQHFADITVPGTSEFPDRLRDSFLEQYAAARAVGGVFVPVMHPLYFDIAHYIQRPMNLWRILAFMPEFAVRLAKTKRGQSYSNLVD